jgi:hypothetical protein
MLARSMYLQLFAEGDGAEGTPAQEPADNSNAAGSNEQKNPFDDFLKDPENQAEFDRRVAKALDTQKKNLSADYAKNLDSAKKEAEKLAKMNADQKRDYDMEKLREENEALKKQAARIELSKTASVLLKEQKVDATQDILDFVVGEDAEQTKANIDKFVGIIESVKKAAEVQRATGSAPKNYGGGEELTEIQKRIAKYK